MSRKTHRVPQWSKPGAYVTVEQGATAGATIGADLRNADGSLFVAPTPIAATLRTTDDLPEGRFNRYGPSPMTTAERDAIASPRLGRVIFNTTTGKHEGWDGTVWQAFY